MSGGDQESSGEEEEEEKEKILKLPEVNVLYVQCSFKIKHFYNVYPIVKIHVHVHTESYLIVNTFYVHVYASISIYM